MKVLNGLAAGRSSVVVPVPLMGGVAVPVVHIVDMITVGHGHVPALRPVLVIVTVVRGVGLRLALVHMIVVEAMQATVMDVVNVIVMRHRYMSTGGPMGVRVIGVPAMFGSR
ncbi:hypothetical protein [Nonomuraea sp. NPDC050691]|uniref:hypothetical protein n=1 Tax=Nonomuraea sp. NPDC050691 TaxID=3155661 RepID=UPI0033F28129